jgi:hypothetical protein
LFCYRFFLFFYNCQTDSCLIFEWQKIRAVDSFERCEALGFPVMESYPRQCRAGDKIFTEIVTLEYKDLIKVFEPLPESLVSSPLTIKGEARGGWYFEADFPIFLFDEEGNQLAVVVAQALDDWMTEDYVPFEAEMAFPTPQTDTGYLILEKDNPSGLAEHADQVRLPVRFR